MRFNKKLKLNFIVIFLIIISVFLVVNANKVLLSYADASFEAQKSNSVYLALGDVLDEFESLSDIIIVEKDDGGNIVFVSTNTFKLNAFSKKIVDKTYEYFNKAISSGVDIPIGAFTGIKFLSGVGSKINFKLISVASVKCDYYTIFQEAGINQTRHQTFLKFVINYEIITTFETRRRESFIEIMCYDNVIIGKVPEIYLTK